MNDNFEESLKRSEGIGHYNLERNLYFVSIDAWEKYHGTSWKQYVTFMRPKQKVPHE